MAGGVATQRGPEPAESQTRSPGGPRQLDPDGKLGSGSGIFVLRRWADDLWRYFDVSGAVGGKEMYFGGS